MKLFFCDITEASHKDFRKWFENTDSERKEAVLRLKIAQKRKLSIAADNLCRSAISDFCGVSPESIVFRKNEYGKPYAVDLPVYFNISHSGDMVVCAVSEREIGTDIEKIRSINARTAEKFAGLQELEYIKNSDNGFFEIWTLKEAYFKCIGTGLSSYIKNVSFNIEGSKISCSESGFEFSFHKIKEDYICSVCEKISE